MYTAFYSPKIRTPMLHFIGSLDTVVVEERTLTSHNACENSRLVYHPGGHYVPASQREFVGVLIGFMREQLEKQEVKAKEESVEDMEMPF